MTAWDVVITLATFGVVFFVGRWVLFGRRP